MQPVDQEHSLLERVDVQVTRHNCPAVAVLVLGFPNRAGQLLALDPLDARVGLSLARQVGVASRKPSDSGTPTAKTEYRVAARFGRIRPGEPRVNSRSRL